MQERTQHQYNSRHSSSVRLARALALVGSVAAGLAVFWGLRDILALDGGLSSWAIPIAAATALACFLAGGWHMILGGAPEAKGHHSAIVLGLGGVLTAITIATSAWWLATALGGSSATRHHHQLFFLASEKAADKVLDSVEPERALIGSVQRVRTGYQQLAQAEERFGVLSGRRGCGRVCEQIKAAAGQFLEIEDDMSDDFNRREAMIANARETLRGARNASSEGDNLQTSQLIIRASNQLAEAKRISLTESASVLQLIPIAATGERLAELETQTLRIPELAREIDRDREAIEFPAWQPLARSEAVVTYADHVSLAWVVAVSLDLLPLLLLGVIAAAKAREDDDVVDDQRTEIHEVELYEESKPALKEPYRPRQA